MGFAPSSTVWVGGVRDLGGNIGVIGQPVTRASTISAKVEATRHGARGRRCGNTPMASKAVGLEASARREEPADSQFGSIRVGEQVSWRSSQPWVPSSFSRAAPTGRHRRWWSACAPTPNAPAGRSHAQPDLVHKLAMRR